MLPNANINQLLITSVLSCVAAATAGLMVARGNYEIVVIIFLVFGVFVALGAPIFLLFLTFASWAFFWLPGLPLNVLELAKDGLLLGWIAIETMRVLLKERRIIALLPSLAAILLALFVVILLPALVISPLERGLAIWSRYALTVLAYGLLVRLFRQSPQLAPLSLQIMVAPVLFSALYVVALTITGSSPLFTPPPEFRAAGIEGVHFMGFTYRYSAMSWAVAFVLPIPIGIVLQQWKTAHRIAWVWLLIVAVLGFALVFSRGRGGLLGALVGTVIVFVALAPKRLRTWVAILLLLGVSGLLASNPSYIEEYLFKDKFSIEQLLDVGLNEQTVARLTSGRTSLWGAGIDAILDAPWTGLGLGQTGAIVDISGDNIGTHLHNLYLNTGAAAGIVPGIFILGCMMYILIHYFAVVRRNQRMVLPGGNDNSMWGIIAFAIICVYLVSTVVEIGIMFSSQYLGLVFWVALASLDMIEQHSKNKIENTRHG